MIYPNFFKDYKPQTLTTLLSPQLFLSTDLPNIHNIEMQASDVAIDLGCTPDFLKKQVAFYLSAAS